MVGAIALAGMAALAATPIRPEVIETRTVTLKQTVTLADIPKDAGTVKLWVPVPSDAAWQRVLERKVVAAPAGWKLVRQADGRGDFVYAETKGSAGPTASVVVECVVETRGVSFPLGTASASGELQSELFPDDLNQKAPLMESDAHVRELADKACGKERDPAKQAMLIQQAVAGSADHYSKDATKPKCGRGAASDCMEHGGGCCTDLHSLFVAMARSRGVPARIQYGYRLLESKAGKPFDPGYRCWVDYNVPGAGWVPTDVVASDNAESSNPNRWASLSSQRVWLWEGRSFELTPKSASGPVHTMICGWAEIDGKPVDVLPAADGTPSKLGRTLEFTVLSSERKADTPKLPE
jgi:transglutaminase-like putative cysteine protease